MNDRPRELQEIEKIVGQVDEIIQHFKQLNRFSREDISYLKEIVFHIDNLLVKIESSPKFESNFFTQNIVGFLTEANKHLRKVLLKEEHTQHKHAQHQQEENSSMLAPLIRQLESLK